MPKVILRRRPLIGERVLLTISTQHDGQRFTPHILLALLHQSSISITVTKGIITAYRARRCHHNLLWWLTRQCKRIVIATQGWLWLWWLLQKEGIVVVIVAAKAIVIKVRCRRRCAHLRHCACSEGVGLFLLLLQLYLTAQCW